MSTLEKDMIQTLKQLVLNCTIKREMLLQSAVKRAKLKRRLALWSGILALTSAGAIITVLGKILGSDIIQIIAACLALTSGILSLVSNVNFTVEDTSNIFEASSKYYSLSSKFIQYCSSHKKPQTNFLKI